MNTIMEIDPICFHVSFQSCDTVDNINQEVYLQMSQAAAYVLNVIVLGSSYSTCEISK